MAAPDFPEDVPTQDLIVIDFQKVLENDAAEEDLLWKAATECGFW